MTEVPAKISLLFETSWEVCNKIGGIYTVLSTKAASLREEFGDNVIFIGPDVWSEKKPSPSFTEEKIDGIDPSKSDLPHGITFRAGRWEIPGRPKALLISFKGVYEDLNNIFGLMWRRFRVDSLHANGDYPEGCAFAVAASVVIEHVTRLLGIDPKNVAAHFDEWTTGMGLLNLELIQPATATLFTTHATSIGRSICSNGKPLYDYFPGYHGPQMAQELNMEAKNSLETAAAANADCFTTVSDVTARECTQLLGVTPQVVTPNGFERDFIPSPQRAASLRAKGRKRLIQIASALSGRKFADDALIVATSGRNEYRNKGLDLFIDSIDAFAEKLAATDRDVLALILVPGWVKEPDSYLVKALADGTDISSRGRFSTHFLNNEEYDPLFRRLADTQSARSGSKVTIILIPCYLDGRDGVLDMAYYDLIPALDITVFPSYYEPWGYTPLESVAFRVPTVTTDKSGFGQWVASTSGSGLEKSGVEVVPRNDSDYNAARDLIASTLLRFIRFNASTVARCRKAAAATATRADWKEFIKFYNKAFAIAEKRRDERCNKNDNEL